MLQKAGGNIKGKSTLLLTIAGVVAVTALLTAYITDFTIHLNQMMHNKTELSLAEASSQYTAMFESRIQRQMAILEVAARNLELAGGITAANAEQIADTACKDIYFDVMYIIDAEGNGHYGDIPFSVAEMSFFKLAIAGHNASGTPIISKITKESTLALAVPVRKDNGVEGVLFGTYNLDRPGALSLNNAFENSGCGFVTTENGQIVLQSDTSKQFWEGDNLIELFKQSTLKKYSIEQLERDIGARKGNSFEFVYQDHKSSVHFLPTEVDGWYTFVMATPKIVASETKEFIDLVLTLGLRIGITVVLVLLAMLWQRRQQNRKMNDAAQRIVKDNEELKSQREELNLGEQRFQLAIGLSGGAIFEYDINRRIYNFFENTEQLMGCTPAQMIEKMDKLQESGDIGRQSPVFRGGYHDDDLQIVEDAYKQLFRDSRVEYQARVLRPDGGAVWCIINLLLMYDEAKRPTKVFGHLSDINDIKLYNEQLKRQASTDPMTGLLNKVSVKDSIDRSLGCDSACGALLILDIDNFKGVNDTMGHVFGDSVLIEAAGKLQKVMDKSNILGRIGGDEFVAYIPAFTDREQVLRAAERVCKAFHLNYIGEHSDYKVSCSIGIAFTDADCRSYDMLYAHADAALYHSKAEGKDRYHVYANGEKAAHSSVGQQNTADLKIVGRMLSIRERVFELLYGAVDFMSGVNMALSMLGQYYDASRVYIFENTRDNMFTRNSYEWCSEAALSKMRTMGRRSLTDGLGYNYLSLFDNRGVFFCDDITKLDAPTANQMAKSSVRSLLQVAIMEGDVVRGFIGIDDCTKNRIFTCDEIETMVHVAKIIGVFVLKKRTNDEAYLSNRDKVEALDKLPINAYVIDSDFCLQYMNQSTGKCWPNALIGDFCYESLMGSTAPCANCPALECEEGPCERIMANPICKRRFFTTASRFNWSGMEDSTLICCQDITAANETPPVSVANSK